MPAVRLARVCAALAVSLATQSNWSQTSDANGPLSTGLLPVHDISGEAQGADFAWYFTSVFYDLMKAEGRELVLLNPGAAYTPLNGARTIEFARSAGVGIVLQSQLAPAHRTGPRDDHPRLQVDVEAVEVASGATLHAFSVTREVSRKDLDRGFDFGPGFDEKRFLGIPGTAVRSYHDASRRIEKQPLGKTIRDMAEAIRSNVLSFSGTMLVYPSAALHPGLTPGSCAIDLAVSYRRARSVSKAYALFVNGREESAAIDLDGVAHVTVRTGSNLFEVAVADAPYKLPVQRGYALNRWIACTTAERHLLVEIGADGEAAIALRPE